MDGLVHRPTENSQTAVWPTWWIDLSMSDADAHELRRLAPGIQVRAFAVSLDA